MRPQKTLIYFVVALLVSTAIFANQAPGNFMTSSLPGNNPNIKITSENLFQQIVGKYFSVAVSQGYYSSGSQVDISQTQTSWNLKCNNALAVLELYQKSHPVAGLSGFASIGSINGNQPFTVHTGFLSGSVPDGYYGAIGYLYCADSYATFSQINGCDASPASGSVCYNYKNGISQIISNVDEQDFGIGLCNGQQASSASCNPTYNPSGSSCIPQYYQQCANGNVYYYDSCGTQGALAQTCQYGYSCVNGACISGVNTPTNTTGTTQLPVVPNIVIVSSNAAVQGNTIVGTITLQNTGASMTSPYIAELQVQNGSTFNSGAGYFAVISPQISTCNADNSQNVHIQFTLGAGQVATYQFSSPLPSTTNPGFPPGTYSSAFAIETACSNNGGQAVPGLSPSVGPFGIVNNLQITQTGGNQTPPPPQSLCNNNNICENAESCSTCGDCVSGKQGYQYVCQGGSPSNSPNFKVTLSTVPSPVVVTTDPNNPSKAAFSVHVVNNGGPGSMKVETGIYSKDQLLSWHIPLQSVVPTNELVANCIAPQTNVQTSNVTLDAGASIDIPVLVQVPQDYTSALSAAFAGGATKTTYYVFTDAFMSCWSYQCGVAAPTGQTSNDYKELNTVAAFSLFASTSYNNINNICSNGVLDVNSASGTGALANTETDTDCGGVCNSIGKQCTTGYKCNSNSDCASGNLCQSGICTNSQTCLNGKDITNPKDSNPPGDGSLISSACPLPGVSTSSACIPEGCPYADYDRTIVGFNSKHSDICCAGLSKTTVDSKDWSLKWIGAGVGTAAGAVAPFLLGGASTTVTEGLGFDAAGNLVNTATTTATKTVVSTPLGFNDIKVGGITGAVGGALGYYIGGKLYSSITDQGVCQSTSFGNWFDSFYTSLQKYTCPVAKLAQIDCKSFTVGIVILGSTLILLILAKILG